MYMPLLTTHILLVLYIIIFFYIIHVWQKILNLFLISMLFFVQILYS